MPKRHLTSCITCGCTLITTTSGDITCHECRERQKEAERAITCGNENNNYTVVYCPPIPGDELTEYPIGANFGATEMREMDGHQALVPGMVLVSSRGYRYVVNNKNRKVLVQ